MSNGGLPQHSLTRQARVSLSRSPMNGSIWAFRSGTKAHRMRLTFERCRVAKMTFGYVQPFSFLGTPSAIKVAGVRHGVTEITLSDGRLVRASLHIKDVKPSAERPGSLDISYNVRHARG